MIIPIRGGFQLIPINESTVFFSNYPLANQAAINLPWTFIHSILEWAYMPDGNPYQKFNEEKAIKIIKDSGGLAILAHPHSMKFSTNKQFENKLK